MAIVSLPYTFSAGATIIASQHNSNFSTIYNDYNGNITNVNISSSAGIIYSKLNLTNGIVNSDINSSAAIADSKLAEITTAGKVSGSALTTLPNIPSGAGVIPVLNLGSGTANSTTVLYGDQTYKSVTGLSNALFMFEMNQTAITVNPTGNGKATITGLPGTGLSYVNSAKMVVYACNPSSSNVVVARTRFLKILGVNTITLEGYVWIGTTGGGRTGDVHFTVGSAVGATVTTTSSTPATFSSACDVSGLSNGTEYDISIILNDEVVGGNSTAVFTSELIGYGS